jgi:hypothetical protein
LPIVRPNSYPSISQRYPASEAAFLKEHDLSGNLFHEFRVGGFLEWSLPPSCKVFIDGRYGPFNAVGMDYYRAHQTVEKFQDLLKQYPAEIALYAYPTFRMTPDPKGPPRGPSAMLFPQKEWAMVTMGDYGMVFLRRVPRFQEAIGAMEYTVLRPDDLPYLVWAAQQGRIEIEALSGDLARAATQTSSQALRQRFTGAQVLLHEGEKGSSQ